MFQETFMPQSACCAGKVCRIRLRQASARRSATNSTRLKECWSQLLPASSCFNAVARASYCGRELYSWAEMRTTRRGGAGHEMSGTSIPCFSRKESCSGYSLKGRRGPASGAASGRGTEASEPMNSSGHGSLMPKAAQRILRPASTSPRLCTMISGQPPGRSEAMKSSAGTTLRMVEGSVVPCQPNSSWKRERSRRAELAPWLMVNGRMSFCRSGRTCRKATLLGAHSHL